MNAWVLVLRAADQAARWHADQRRKGHAEEPYVNHLIEVASLVTEATDGADPNVVIAALLHDAVEDQKVPIDTIAREFRSTRRRHRDGGDRRQDVAQGGEKARSDRDRGPRKKSREAKLIKLADKTSNVRAVASASSRRRLVGEASRRLHRLGQERGCQASRDISLAGTGVDEAADRAVQSLTPLWPAKMTNGGCAIGPRLRQSSYRQTNDFYE